MWSIYGDGAVMVIPSVSSIEWLVPVVSGITSESMISLVDYTSK